MTPNRSSCSALTGRIASVPGGTRPLPAIWTTWELIVKIWIDADATPREVKEIVFRAKQAFASALDRALTHLRRAG